MSDNTKNLFQRLLDASKRIKGVGKTYSEKLGYKAVTNGDIVEVVKTALDESGIFLTIDMDLANTFHEAQELTTSKGYKITQYNATVFLSYEFVNVDKPEDKIVKVWKMTAVNNDSAKAYGAALTYAEKYFLMKFFNIPTNEDDPDFNKPHYEEVKEPTPEEIEKEKQEKLLAYFNKNKEAYKTGLSAKAQAGISAFNDFKTLCQTKREGLENLKEWVELVQSFKPLDIPTSLTDAEINIIEETMKAKSARSYKEFWDYIKLQQTSMKNLENNQTWRDLISKYVPVDPLFKSDEVKKEELEQKLNQIESKLKLVSDFTEWTNYIAKCVKYDPDLEYEDSFVVLANKYKPSVKSEPNPTLQQHLTEISNELVDSFKISSTDKVQQYLIELSSVIGKGASVVLPFASKLESEREGLADDLDWQQAKSKALVGKRAG